MKKSLLGAAALLLTVSAAHSADLYQPEPLPLMDAPEITVQEASGWYLRGDVGYSFNKSRGAEYFQGSNELLSDFDTTSLKDSFLVGAGVGYQINNYLRTDLTFDYMKSDFEGSTSGGGAGGSTACAIACTSRDVSTMNAYSLLANAYVDLGTYGSVTPYVGAGMGGTYVDWKNLRNTSCADNGNGCDDTVEHGGDGSWRFTYALMAGATIDITCALKADVGYRFRHVTGGDMFGYAQDGGPGSDKGFYSHEARVGARYLLGGCDTPVSYEPPIEPIVYK